MVIERLANGSGITQERGKPSRLDQHVFETGSVKLKYLEAGDIEASPVLLLHGLGYKGTTYDETIRKISKDHHILAPDLHFSFKKQAISSQEDYVNVLHEFIKTKDLKNITVIGHSFGGAIALKLAETTSDISRLILADTGGFPTSRSVEHLSALLVLKTCHELKYKGQLPILTKLVADFGIFIAKSLPHPLKTRQAVADAYGKEHIQQYENIKIPALLLHGKNDEIFSQEHADYLKQKITDSKLIMVNGNHDWILFNGQEFNKLLTEYCKQDQNLLNSPKS
jgi:2-hydroxy-6-oxonona-2,4-dienedioate hydrolase